MGAHLRWCLQIRGIYQHGVMLQRCVNVTVANFTMHNVGMFGIIDWAGHNSRVYACLLVPAPCGCGHCNCAHCALQYCSYCKTPQISPRIHPLPYWTVAPAWVQLLDNTLAPYPGQIGNGEQAALLASNGDGIHSLGASFGPLIRGNKLVNMGDDGITVHGLFFLVIKASGSPPDLVVCAINRLP